MGNCNNDNLKITTVNKQTKDKPKTERTYKQTNKNVQLRKTNRELY